MISKYLLWASVLTVNILLLSSCLGSGSSEYEYPVDPQIYAISMASATDSTSQLTSLAFTIDQLKSEIYNKKPLPYLFHVDSVMLSLTGSSTYYSFAGVELTFVEPDTSYFWNMSDSIPIVRLQKIKTYAPDAVTSKEYSFQLNIYQEDPDSIQWERMATNHPASTVINQKTIAFGNRFFTYFQTETGGEIKAVSSPISGTLAWEPVTLSGFPNILQLSSLIAVGNNLYALDDTNGWVYRSTDGVQWAAVSIDYKVKALYGELPSTTSGRILLAVEDGGSLKYAYTNSDFSETTFMNGIPNTIPVTGFSSLSTTSVKSFASKFILLSNGTTADNTGNEEIWLLEMDGNTIRSIPSDIPEETTIKGSTLFFYDEKPYLVAISNEGANILLHSDDFGLRWIAPEDKNNFPTAPIAFPVRTNASVLIDADNYIWIFGGVSSTNPSTWLTDIWKGRLNKFGLQ